MWDGRWEKWRWPFEDAFHEAVALPTPSPSWAPAAVEHWDEGVLQQFDELLDAESCLIDDGGQRFALEVPIVICDGDAGYRAVRVLEDVM